MKRDVLMAALDRYSELSFDPQRFIYVHREDDGRQTSVMWHEAARSARAVIDELASVISTGKADPGMLYATRLFNEHAQSAHELLDAQKQIKSLEWRNAQQADHIRRLQDHIDGGLSS